MSHKDDRENVNRLADDRLIALRCTVFAPPSVTATQVAYVTLSVAACRPLHNYLLPSKTILLAMNVILMCRLLYKDCF